MKPFQSCFAEPLSATSSSARARSDGVYSRATGFEPMSLGARASASSASLASSSDDAAGSSGHS